MSKIKNVVGVVCGLAIVGAGTTAAVKYQLKLNKEKKNLYDSKKDELEKALMDAYKVLPIESRENFRQVVSKFKSDYKKAENTVTAELTLRAEMAFFNDILNLKDSDVTIRYYVWCEQLRNEVDDLKDKLKTEKFNLLISRLSYIGAMSELSTARSLLATTA